MSSAAAGLFLGGWTTAPIRFESNSAMTKVALARLSGYDQTSLRSALEYMLASIGGLRDLVRPGDHVGIKINLTGGSSWAWSYQSLTGLHPGETYWTNLEILRAVGEIMLDAGAGKISILEAVYGDRSYFNFGYHEIGAALGAQFVDLDQTAPYSSYSVRPVGDDHFIYPTLTQNGILDDLDCVVSLAKSKQHVGAGVTHGMKNLVGTLPVPAGLYNNGQGHRAGIHEQTGLDGNPVSNLRRVVLDLNHATPINLVVNDAISTVLGGEGPWQPSLTPANFDSLIVSKDPVAADSIATSALGLDPSAADDAGPFAGGINYLSLAEEIGMGTADPSQIEVVEAPSTRSEDETLPESGLGSVHCFPNPFAEGTTFEFVLGTAALVELSVYDLSGRRIAILPAKRYGAGRGRTDWDGNTRWGHPAAPGSYIAVVASQGIRKTLKLVRSR